MTPPRQDAFLHNHVLDSMATDFMWTDMTFSDDDRFIALSGSRGIVLVDAFSLREVREAGVWALIRCLIFPLHLHTAP